VSGASSVLSGGTYRLEVVGDLDLPRTGRRLRILGASPRTVRVVALARAESLLDQPRPDPHVLDLMVTR
jgi:hypothetical protein